MPRPRSRSRSGSMGRRSTGRTSTFATRPPASKNVNRPRSQGLLSGIGSTMAHGMAFGAGSEVAHQAVRGIMGPNYETSTYSS